MNFINILPVFVFKKVVFNSCLSFWLSRQKSIHLHHKITCSKTKCILFVPSATRSHQWKFFTYFLVFQSFQVLLQKLKQKVPKSACLQSIAWLWWCLNKWKGTYVDTVDDPQFPLTFCLSCCKHYSGGWTSGAAF